MVGLVIVLGRGWQSASSHDWHTQLITRTEYRSFNIGELVKVLKVSCFTVENSSTFTIGCDETCPKQSTILSDDLTKNN